MDSIGILEGFLFGLLGGLIVEVLGLYRLRVLTRDEFPEHLKTFHYWAITTAMILAGGGLAVVYLSSDIPLKPILAVNIGASAPLIIEGLGKLQHADPGTSG